MKEIILNSSASVTETVTENLTAKAVGSGSLLVFGTPMMIALMEKTTCKAVEKFLENDETTVGTKINVSHISPSVVGKNITVSAKISEVNGKAINFEVTACDDNGVIGKGEISRFVVNSQKFMAKAENK